jgi:putative transposase
LEKGYLMKNRHSSEQIIKMLREAEAKITAGTTVEAVCRELGVSEATYYKWRKSYGHLEVDQAKRLKDLEKENGRLKKLVADLSLDKAILQEALSGKY